MMMRGRGALAMSVTCDLCGRPVDPDASSTYRWTEGWTQRRRQGGANAVRLPEFLEAWAHATCVDAEARKVNARQGGLFG